MYKLNNKSITLNILYGPCNLGEIRHAHRSKHNLTCKNQVILLMITEGKISYYFAVKKVTIT